jgi:hypothetical protein
MKGTINEKLGLLDELAEIESADYIGLPTGLMRHAILNVIPLTELVKFYLKEGAHITSVQSNICKRLEDESELIEIYDLVIEQLKVADYVNRQRFRQILETIVPKLDHGRQMEYMSFFMGSKYIYEQNSAIELADKIWNEEIRQIIAAAYQQRPSDKILAILVNHVDDEEALILVRHRWTGSIPKYLVVRLMERLKGRTLHEIDFLREVDPANYIALLRFSNGLPDEQTLRQCYQQVPQRSRPYAIWVLGRLGKWDIIEPDIKTFLAEPQFTFPGFSEQLFEKYS